MDWVGPCRPLGAVWGCWRCARTRMRARQRAMRGRALPLRTLRKHARPPCAAVDRPPCPAPPRCQVLDLSHNRLSGTLPPSWGRLAFLSSLALRNNTLNGTLPDAWSDAKSLLQLCARRPSTPRAARCVHLHDRRRGRGLAGSWQPRLGLPASHNTMHPSPRCAQRRRRQPPGGRAAGAVGGGHGLPAFGQHDQQLHQRVAARPLAQPDVAAGAVRGPRRAAAPAGAEGTCSWARQQACPGLSGLAPPLTHTPPPRHRSVGSNNLSGKIPAAWSTLPLHSLQVSRNDGVCGDVPAGVSGVTGGNTQLNSTCPWNADGARAGRGDHCGHRGAQHLAQGL